MLHGERLLIRPLRWGMVGSSEHAVHGRFAYAGLAGEISYNRPPHQSFSLKESLTLLVPIKAYFVINLSL